MVPLPLSIATLFVVINVVYVNGVSLTIDPNLATVYVQEYRPLNMTCRSVGSDSLNWYKGMEKASDLGFTSSQRIDADPSGGSATTLSIHAISKPATSVSDSGDYRCESDNTASSARTITVKVVSVRTVNPEYNRSMETAALACLLTNVDSTKYSMYWEFKGKKLTEDEKYKIYKENNTLVIIDPVHSDGGEYSCVFNFTESNDIIVPVNFYAAPIVKKFEKSKNLIQGDPLTLRCVVYSHPATMISWRKDGVALFGKDRIVISTDEQTGLKNAKLEIKDVNFDDKGNYSCVANSSYFNIAQTGHILVRVKDKLAALWPFLGIVAEVIVLCVIIFIYEKRRSRSDETDDATDAGNCANAADHKGKEEVRQRNVRT